MLHSNENTLHLTQLSAEAIRQLSPSFSKLPNTAHADGQYRLRRYSVIRSVAGKVVEEDKHNFVQTEHFNHFQGDVIRNFEPIASATLQSAGMHELVSLFMATNQLPDGQEIEIHQMRIAAVYDETQVAPEGIHQDGFDHIAIVGVERKNIVGGEVMLYNDNHEAPFFRKVLEDGEVAILDDHRLWHNAQPIRCVDNKSEGHMDVFVLTAKEGNNALHS
ncbi:agglutination protein [Vibrio sp. 10N.286.49.C2]|uniref:2OG-Fe dioxygenase family protein n=1 Tax=unclassified Vibrio TaxID=2614977 RepID=UPI000C856351|nr:MULTISPECIES: 2OG-Fe dioxygenase family protein [unclassified Vibrio]PMH31568.1 agglutination protein [Vibrio sp. 10N.286.49.C2]PMH50590.1 agglutination protein [Vibrio sp. 10N.286.49.B1]PMH82047.1 agglutination protein [Vibrio sp. 10N.286.48.B7]